MKKKTLSLLLAFCLTLALLPAAGTGARAAASFSDVPSGAWYAQDVAEVQSSGIINGVGDGKFDPTGTLTIAQAITLAARTRALYDKETIPTGSVWYEGPLSYAVSKGIATAELYTSESGSYYLDSTCSRKEMSRLFASALPQSEYAAINTVTAIPDAAENSGNADVYRLYRAGILSGSDGYGTFYPLRDVTRAEAAAIINRLASAEKRKSFSLLTKTTPYDHTSDAVLSAYRDVIEQHMSEGYTNEGFYYYCLYDIDGNGIRELIVGTGSCEADRMDYFYTWSNGKAQLIDTYGSGHTYYLAGEGCILCQWAHMDVEALTSLSLINGKLVSVLVSSHDYTQDTGDIPEEPAPGDALEYSNLDDSYGLY